MPNVRGPELPKDMSGERLAVFSISESLAVSQYTVPTGTKQTHTLDVAAGMIIITVADYPIKLKADTDVTSSAYDLYLITGQYVLAVGSGVTDISMLADGGDALVTLVERSEA